MAETELECLRGSSNTDLQAADSLISACGSFLSAVKYTNCASQVAASHRPVDGCILGLLALISFCILHTGLCAVRCVTLQGPRSKVGMIPKSSTGRVRKFEASVRPNSLAFANFLLPEYVLYLFNDAFSFRDFSSVT